MGKKSGSTGMTFGWNVNQGGGRCPTHDIQGTLFLWTFVEVTGVLIPSIVTRLRLESLQYVFRNTGITVFSPNSPSLPFFPPSYTPDTSWGKYPKGTFRPVYVFCSREHTGYSQKENQPYLRHLPLFSI